MNPLQKIKFDKEYVSGPRASTDMHAGGIFFCVPYEEVIVFSEDGTVVLSRRVIEHFRPMDGRAETDRRYNFKKEGRYELSKRGYILCRFDGLTMWGLPLKVHQYILSFHCYSEVNGVSFGNAFGLSDG